MSITEEQIRIANAKKRVAQLKGFYMHSIIYVIVNMVILIIQTDYLRNFDLNGPYAVWRYITTPVFWGLGLFLHGLFVFLPRLPFVKKWEERKMNEFLNRND